MTLEASDSAIMEISRMQNLVSAKLNNCYNLTIVEACSDLKTLEVQIQL